LRVLLVSDQASPGGGAEVMTRVLRDALRRRGHDARVFATHLRFPGAESFADYTCFGTTSRLRTLLQSFNPWAFLSLRRVLAEFRPDVVHVRIFLTQLSPTILPLLRDRPSLYSAVWPRAVCPLGTKVLPDGSRCRERAGLPCYRHGCLPIRDWFPLMLQRRLWNAWRGALDLIVANSEACRGQLLEDGVSPVEVVWNGVPVVPARPPLSGPPEAAFAGRLVRQKGADVLLRAFAQVATEIPTARLLVAGDGPEWKSLERQAEALGISSRVAMLGLLSSADLERRLAGAWVQVVPSRWTESFGLVAAEAMMRGTAVVASNLGGLPEYIKDGETGHLVPSGDDRALAKALVRILRDRDLAEQIGGAARRFALAELSDEVCAGRFLERYERLLNRHGEAGASGAPVGGQP